MQVRSKAQPAKLVISKHRVDKISGNLKLLADKLKQLVGDLKLSFLHGCTVGNKVEEAVSSERPWWLKIWLFKALT